MRRPVVFFSLELFYFFFVFLLYSFVGSWFSFVFILWFLASWLLGSFFRDDLSSLNAYHNNLAW